VPGSSPISEAYVRRNFVRPRLRRRVSPCNSMWRGQDGIEQSAAWPRP